MLLNFNRLLLVLGILGISFSCNENNVEHIGEPTAQEPEKPETSNVERNGSASGDHAGNTQGEDYKNPFEFPDETPVIENPEEPPKSLEERLDSAPPMEPPTSENQLKPGSSQFTQCLSSDKNKYAIKVWAYRKIYNYWDPVEDALKIKNRDFDLNKYHEEIALNFRFLGGESMVNLLKNEDPFVQFCMSHYNVPTQDYKAGFPRRDGSGNIIEKQEEDNEWFAFYSRAKIELSRPGTYKFFLDSDDGSILYLRKVGSGDKFKAIIDHDGLHAVRKFPPNSDQMATKTADFTVSDGDEGMYDLIVYYFQGLPYSVALQLYWIQPGESQKVIVPPEKFFFYKD